MGLLLLCVLVNAFIAVIFKYFDKYSVDTFPAIVVNYYVCVITGSIVLGEFPISADMVGTSWFPYALVMSILFILTFTLMGNTVRGFGIVVATIFQKMSLISPTLIGILIFAESSGWLKIVGILLAMVSILVITKSDREPTINPNYRLWIYPAVVFLGSCIIDSLFYIINKKELLDSGDLHFVITLFFLAGIWGTFILGYQILTGKARLSQKSVMAGIGLGIPNLFSIYLLVLVLSQGMDGSVVFPVNNVGILATSAILGVILFGERLGKIQLSGLLLAAAAIVLIAYG